MFSVLISVYSKENPIYFAMALESIYAQTLLPSEVILIQDGPIGIELENVVELFSEKLPIRCIVLEKNVGLGEALNIGLSECQFDIVMRADSDDVNFPERFKNQYDFLIKNPNIAVVSAHVAEFQEDLNDDLVIKRIPLDKAISTSILTRNPINHMAAALRKSAVLSVGNYQDMPLMEDYYLWLRLHFGHFKLANLDEVLVYARVGNDMLGRRRGWRYAMSELRLLKVIYHKGWSANWLVGGHFILRAFIRLMPKSVLELIYRYLRSLPKH
ncbi:glycosyltransferase [Vibrio sp. CK2-1]|uniref:glycosyltransferase n=1 Tax=Vibrio sp. CK2-1 TaxID=2912249 RepID=UPI001F1C5CCF|nr:glycosyltransferase [Vibrio sp. CK2-1]MCF7355637.1 glycosyltransferase [Vibrio sp. CK2-1]